MTSAVISSSKTVTIPAEVLLDLKAEAGDRVDFIQIAPGRYEFLAASINVTELKGMFGQKSESVSIHDMNKAHNGLCILESVRIFASS